jgi:hypothetical protein
MERKGRIGGFPRHPLVMSLTPNHHKAETRRRVRPESPQRHAAESSPVPDPSYARGDERATKTQPKAIDALS